MTRPIMSPLINCAPFQRLLLAAIIHHSAVNVIATCFCFQDFSKIGLSKSAKGGPPWTQHRSREGDVKTSGRTPLLRFCSVTINETVQAASGGVTGPTLLKQSSESLTHLRH